MDKVANLQKETVVNDALRITSVLNKHLSEEDCSHTIRQIAMEALKE